MKEILSLNFGQAGCQIGNSNYHLFAQEYGMIIPCRDHHKDSHHQHQQPQQQQEELFMDERYYKVLYEEWDPGSGSDHHSSSMQSYYYTPRSLFMDLDSSNLDSIRVRNHQSSSNAVHYRPDSFIGGQEDASSVCTRAKYSMGRILLDSCMESIRKYLERCDRLDSLWIHAGLGGGSGSGLTSLIMEQLGCDLNKVTKIFIPVMPSPQRSNVIVEPYNVVLGLKDLHDKVDASIVLDNEALYHYVSHWKNEVVGVGGIGEGGINYSQLNEIISHAVSSLTSGVRFNQNSITSYGDMKSLVRNMVPYPTLNFLTCSLVPLQNHSSIVSKNEMMTIPQSTMQCFEPCSLLTSVNLKEGKYMNVSLKYCGNVSMKEVNQSIQCLKRSGIVHDHAVPWTRVGVHCETVSKGKTFGSNHETSIISMLANSTVMGGVFDRIMNKCDKLYDKRAYVHWFVGEGMESGEFEEAREVVRNLAFDYHNMENMEQ